MHVAGASILPLQQSTTTTAHTGRTTLHLLVALVEDGTAAGDLFMDDVEGEKRVQPGEVQLYGWVSP